MKTSYREKDYKYGSAMLNLRTAISVTQEGLGNILGVSGRMVGEWEAGGSYPKTERLKKLIALAVQHQAFTPEHEAEEIRALWKVARQKVLLDEDWLSALLLGQAQELHVTPPHGAAAPTDSQIPTLESRARLLSGDLPTTEHLSVSQLPHLSTVPVPQAMSSAPIATELAPMAVDLAPGSKEYGNNEHTEAVHAGKTRGRRKWLLRILIALSILTIIDSAGTLFLQARENTSAGAYLSGKDKLAFVDPLREASGSKWIVWSKPGWNMPDSTGGPCEFIGGTYHAITGNGQHDAQCPALAEFSDFVFEVRLTIVQGDCGGMFFRAPDEGHIYYFSICQNGLFNVFGGPDPMNKSSYSLAIHTGLGKPNTIAVEASGSRVLFYVNSQQIDQERDSNPTSGRIGLIADPHDGSPTEVAFSNARVWTL